MASNSVIRKSSRLNKISAEKSPASFISSERSTEFYKGTEFGHFTPKKKRKSLSSNDEPSSGPSSHKIKSDSLLNICDRLCSCKSEKTTSVASTATADKSCALCSNYERSTECANGSDLGNFTPRKRRKLFTCNDEISSGPSSIKKSNSSCNISRKSDRLSPSKSEKTTSKTSGISEEKLSPKKSMKPKAKNSENKTVVNESECPKDILSEIPTLKLNFLADNVENSCSDIELEVELNKQPQLLEKITDKSINCIKKKVKERDQFSTKKNKKPQYDLNIQTFVNAQTVLTSNLSHGIKEKLLQLDQQSITATQEDKVQVKETKECCVYDTNGQIPNACKSTLDLELECKTPLDNKINGFQLNYGKTADVSFSNFSLLTNSTNSAINSNDFQQSSNTESNTYEFKSENSTTNTLSHLGTEVSELKSLKLPSEIQIESMKYKAVDKVGDTPIKSILLTNHIIMDKEIISDDSNQCSYGGLLTSDTEKEIIFECTSTCMDTENSAKFTSLKEFDYLKNDNEMHEDSAVDLILPIISTSNSSINLNNCDQKINHAACTTQLAKKNESADSIKCLVTNVPTLECPRFLIENKISSFKCNNDTYFHSLRVNSEKYSVSLRNEDDVVLNFDLIESQDSEFFGCVGEKFCREFSQPLGSEFSKFVDETATSILKFSPSLLASSDDLSNQQNSNVLTQYSNCLNTANEKNPTSQSTITSVDSFPEVIHNHIISKLTNSTDLQNSNSPNVLGPLDQPNLVEESNHAHEFTIEDLPESPSSTESWEDFKRRPSNQMQNTLTGCLKDEKAQENDNVISESSLKSKNTINVDIQVNKNRKNKFRLSRFISKKEKIQIPVIDQRKIKDLKKKKHFFDRQSKRIVGNKLMSSPKHVQMISSKYSDSADKKDNEIIGNVQNLSADKVNADEKGKNHLSYKTKLNTSINHCHNVKRNVIEFRNNNSPFFNEKPLKGTELLSSSVNPTDTNYQDKRMTKDKNNISMVPNNDNNHECIEKDHNNLYNVTETIDNSARQCKEPYNLDIINMIDQNVTEVINKPTSKVKCNKKRLASLKKNSVTAKTTSYKEKCSTLNTYNEPNHIVTTCNDSKMLNSPKDFDFRSNSSSQNDKKSHSSTVLGNKRPYLSVTDDKKNQTLPVNQNKDNSYSSISGNKKSDSSKYILSDDIQNGNKCGVKYKNSRKLSKASKSKSLYKKKSSPIIHVNNRSTSCNDEHSMSSFYESVNTDENYDLKDIEFSLSKTNEVDLKSALASKDNEVIVKSYQSEELLSIKMKKSLNNSLNTFVQRKSCNSSENFTGMLVSKNLDNFNSLGRKSDTKNSEPRILSPLKEPVSKSFKKLIYSDNNPKPVPSKKESGCKKQKISHPNKTEISLKFPLESSSPDHSLTCNGKLLKSKNNPNKCIIEPKSKALKSEGKIIEKELASGEVMQSIDYKNINAPQFIKEHNFKAMPNKILSLISEETCKLINQEHCIQNDSATKNNNNDKTEYKFCNKDRLESFVSNSSKKGNKAHDNQHSFRHISNKLSHIAEREMPSNSPGFNHDWEEKEEIMFSDEDPNESSSNKNVSSYSNLNDDKVCEGHYFQDDSGTASETTNSCCSKTLDMQKHFLQNNEGQNDSNSKIINSSYQQVPEHFSQDLSVENSVGQKKVILHTRKYEDTNPNENIKNLKDVHKSNEHYQKASDSDQVVTGEINSEELFKKCFVHDYCLQMLLNNLCYFSKCDRRHHIDDEFFNALKKEEIACIVLAVFKKAKRVSVEFMTALLNFFSSHGAKTPILSLSKRFLSKELFSEIKFNKSYFGLVSNRFFLALEACGISRPIKILEELINYNIKVFLSCDFEKINCVLEGWNIASPSLDPIWPILKPLAIIEGLIFPDNILRKLFEEAKSTSASDSDCLAFVANQLLKLSTERLVIYEKKDLEKLVKIVFKAGLTSEADRLSKMLPTTENLPRKNSMKNINSQSLSNMPPYFTQVYEVDKPWLDQIELSNSNKQDLLKTAEIAINKALETGNYYRLLSLVAKYLEQGVGNSVLHFVFSSLNQKEPLIMTELLISEFMEAPENSKYRIFCGSLVSSFVVSFAEDGLWEVSFGFLTLFKKFCINKYRVKTIYEALSPLCLVLIYSEVFFNNKYYQESLDEIINNDVLKELNGLSCNDPDYEVCSQYVESYLQEYLKLGETNISTQLFDYILNSQKSCEPLDLSAYFEEITNQIFEKHPLDKRPLNYYIKMSQITDLTLFGLTIRSLLIMAYQSKKWATVKDLFQKGVECGAYPCLEAKEYSLKLVKSLTEEELICYISEWSFNFKKRLHQGSRNTHFTFSTGQNHIVNVNRNISISFKDENLMDYVYPSKFGIPHRLKEIDESFEGSMARLINVLKTFNFNFSIVNETLIIDLNCILTFLKNVKMDFRI